MTRPDRSIPSSDSLDVVCFGEILWDLFEIRPRGIEPIAREFRRELGGAPANVATGLARLGLRVAMVGGVGRDRFGDALLAQLASDGVDTRWVKQLPNRTGLTFVARDEKSEPEYLFYRHDSADMAIRADQVVPAMGRTHWAFLGTSTLVTPDLARATEAFLETAESSRACILVDLNVRPHLWPSRAAMRGAIQKLVSRAALIKASEADLQALGSPAEGSGWLERFAPRANWLITRGPRSASAVGPHGTLEARATRARCIDATGAGDAFIAGALGVLVRAGAAPGSTAWANPHVWRLALRAGHMMGKKAVSRVGAISGLRNLDRVRTVIGRAAVIGESAPGG